MNGDTTHSRKAVTSGVFLVSSDDTVHHATAQAKALCDLTESDQPTFQELITPACREAYTETHAAVIDTGNTATLECVELETTAGRQFEAAVTVDPVSIGEEPFVVLTVTPTQAEGVETAGQDYAALFEMLPDGVFILDGETQTIIDVNPAGVEMVGYEKEALLGESNALLHPDGERYTAGVKKAMEGMGGGTIRNFPDGSNMYVETKDGEHIPIEMSVNYAEIDGHPIAIGVFHDITPRINREQQAMALQVAIRRLMNATTQEELFRSLAEELERCFSYETVVVRALENERELVPVATIGWEGKDEPATVALTDETPATRAIETDDAQTVTGAKRHEHAGEDDDSTYTGLYVPLGSYGVVTILDTEINPYAGSVELVSSLVACGRSVLERIENEQALAARNERLDQFASLLSHDLRNPLNIAQGYLEVLEAEHGATDAVEEIDRSLTRMEELIDDVLARSREGDDLEYEHVDLEAVVREAWAVVETGDSTLSVQTPRHVVADRSQLQQVFENLLRNAVEHTERPVEITVGATHDGFYFEDDGDGIPADKREAVLEVGFSTDDDGTGFGLGIVNSVVADHGWGLDITDGTDGGARFEFSGVETA